MDEILVMSKEIDYYNLVYMFKGPTKATSFTKFAGPMFAFDQLKKAKKNITTSRKRARRFQIWFKWNIKVRASYMQ